MLPENTVVFGSTNAHKLAEIQHAVGGLFRVVSVADFSPVPDVAETEPTLEGNALLKARAYAQHTGLPTFADDTGLEVDALNGAPGVHSARYAGPQADAAANIALLLAQLGPNPNRRARFRTVIAFVDAHGQQHLFEGLLAGRIVFQPQGTGGFGYDPVFQPEGLECTLAELTVAQKNELSHRGRAIAAFVQYLRSQPN